MHQSSHETLCPICESKDLKFYDQAVDTVWKNNHGVYYCNSCGLYFLNDVTEEETKSYYETDYYKMNDKEIDKLTLTFFVKGLFRRFRSQSQFRFLYPYIKSACKSVLEVGAGDGVFLNLFKRHGFDITGFEYNHRMRAIAKKRFGLELQLADFMEDQSRYDFIAMSHVYEHFLDLKQVTQKIYQSLNAGGFLFLEVPHSPLIHEASESEIRRYINTTHITNFTLSNLSQYLQKSGFEIVRATRTYYRMPILAGQSRQKRLAELFLTGNGARMGDLFFSAIYILRSMIFPSLSYKEMPETLPWLGSGDNIRILARKK